MVPEGKGQETNKAHGLSSQGSFIICAKLHENQYSISQIRSNKMDKLEL